MKNCLIIHGCPDFSETPPELAEKTYAKQWIPWLKAELIARGLPTDNPALPEPWKKDYQRFKSEFEKYPVNDETILIGHSCGCSFLVRWLGETKKSIAKLILVAPWKIADAGDISGPAFYEYAVDSSIADRVGQIIMFTSDNEEADGKKSLAIFQSALGGRIIELPGHGHYTLGDMGTNEFPELLQAVLS